MCFFEKAPKCGKKKILKTPCERIVACFYTAPKFSYFRKFLVELKQKKSVSPSPADCYWKMFSQSKVFSSFETVHFVCLLFPSKENVCFLRDSLSTNQKMIVSSDGFFSDELPPLRRSTIPLGKFSQGYCLLLRKRGSVVFFYFIGQVIPKRSLMTDR